MCSVVFQDIYIVEIKYYFIFKGDETHSSFIYHSNLIAKTKQRERERKTKKKKTDRELLNAIEPKSKDCAVK
jgi:hypothetical protein